MFDHFIIFVQKNNLFINMIYVIWKDINIIKNKKVYTVNDVLY